MRDGMFCIIPLGNAFKGDLLSALSFAIYIQYMESNIHAVLKD